MQLHKSIHNELLPFSVAAIRRPGGNPVAQFANWGSISGALLICVYRNRLAGAGSVGPLCVIPWCPSEWQSHITGHFAGICACAAAYLVRDNPCSTYHNLSSTTFAQAFDDPVGDFVFGCEIFLKMQNLHPVRLCGHHGARLSNREWNAYGCVWCRRPDSEQVF